MRWQLSVGLAAPAMQTSKVPKNLPARPCACKLQGHKQLFLLKAKNSNTSSLLVIVFRSRVPFFPQQTLVFLLFSAAAGHAALPWSISACSSLQAKAEHELQWEAQDLLDISCYGTAMESCSATALTLRPLVVPCRQWLTGACRRKPRSACRGSCSSCGGRRPQICRASACRMRGSATSAKPLPLTTGGLMVCALVWVWLLLHDGKPSPGLLCSVASDFESF